MSEQLVTDFIKRRAERAAATPSPLGEPAGQAPERGNAEPVQPKDGEDLVGAYIRRRNEDAARQPDPLKDRTPAR